MRPAPSMLHCTTPVLWYRMFADPLLENRVVTFPRYTNPVPTELGNWLLSQVSETQIPNGGLRLLL